MGLASVLNIKPKNNPVVLIGGVYGTKEIPLLVKEYIESLDYDYKLCVEIPRNYQNIIKDYKQLQHEDVLLKKEFFAKSTDGKVSKELLELIKAANEVSCIDTDERDTKYGREFREEEIANNIEKENNKPIIALIGNIHAVTSKKFEFLGERFQTTGILLKRKLGRRKVISINVQGEGTFFNIEEQEVTTMDLSRYYDYNYKIDKVTPCTLIGRR